MTIDLRVLIAGAFLVLMALIWKVYRDFAERLGRFRPTSVNCIKAYRIFFCWLRNLEGRLFLTGSPTEPTNGHSRLVWKPTLL